MMIGSLDYPQDCPALLCKPNAFRCKLGLQPARGLTWWERHVVYVLLKQKQSRCNTFVCRCALRTC